MNYNDYELLDLILENDEIAYSIMLKKYKNVIFSKSLEYYKYLKGYNYTGFVLNDFLEEGLVTLDHAIKSFDSNKGVIFYSFFLACLISSFNLMLRTLFAKKNFPLLNYKELDFEISDSCCIDPYDYMDTKDILDKLKNYLYSLNLEDAAIIELRLNMFKYREIMSLLDVTSSKISRVLKVFKEEFTSFSCCNL